MSNILTFNQIEKAKGFSRSQVKERVSTGKLYARKIGSRLFYSTTESAFTNMWEEVLDFADALLKQSFVEPASRLANFLAYYGKKQHSWNLDKVLSKSVAQSLTLERSAGSFLAQSVSGHGYVCLYAESKRRAFEEMIEFAKTRMEATGRIDLVDFAKISKKHCIEREEDIVCLLKHLAYLGWGNFGEDGNLKNPLFNSE